MFVYSFTRRNSKKAADFVYIHIIRYAEDSVGNKDWNGKMQNLREVINVGVNSLSTQIQNANGVLNNRIDNLERKIEEKFSQMLAEFKEIKQKQN